MLAGRGRCKRPGPSLRTTISRGAPGLQPRAYSTDSIHSLSLLFGSAPIFCAATWPPLNRIIVGMPRTPYLRGVCRFSSILTLATVSLPALSAASWSRNGAIILHGPHHSAQKSTRTGSLDFKTLVSNSASLTAVGFIARVSFRCALLTLGEAKKRRQGARHRLGCANRAGLIGISRGPSVHKSAQSIRRPG